MQRWPEPTSEGQSISLGYSGNIGIMETNIMGLYRAYSGVILGVMGSGR